MIKIYCLEEFGFRKIIGIGTGDSGALICAITFYPNSPHWEWSCTTNGEVECSIAPEVAGSAGACSIPSMPEMSEYPKWKKQIEENFWYAELAREPEDTRERIQVSELVYQVMFLSGLTTEEVCSALTTSRLTL